MMLKVNNLETGYRNKQVLFGASLEVGNNEIVALIGPNGAGKSTVLKAIFGLLPIWSGEIVFNGQTINKNDPTQNVSSGISFLAQANRVFDGLSVIENLKIGAYKMPRSEASQRIDYVLEMFPDLKNRINSVSGTLSGGQQQQLALARALIHKPILLLLDEPSLGLSPKLIQLIFDNIVEINSVLNISILIVEQKVRNVLEICNKVYSLKFGRIAYSGNPQTLIEDNNRLKKLFL